MEGGAGDKRPRPIFVSTTLFDCKNCTPSAAQLSYSSAAHSAQRSAVRCPSVPCLALRCGVVPCRAALCFISNTAVPKYHAKFQARVCMYVCTCIFASLIDCSRFRSSSRYIFVANYTRTADQNVTSQTSTQHSTGQSTLHK